METLDRKRRKRGRGIASSSPSVVACLTGMEVDEKERLHTLIEAMGGRYTRDLKCAENTHLIACQAAGAKYEAAVKSKTIVVVKPSWVDACWNHQAKDLGAVDESEHLLCDANENEPEVIGLPIIEVLDKALHDTSTTDDSSNTQVLFASKHFYMVGFQNDENEDIVYRKLTRLIRRCGGTIHWEFHHRQDIITHCITNDGFMDEASRDAALQHPSGPLFLSPRWVVDSCLDGKLLNSFDYLPECKVPDEPKFKDAETKPSSVRPQIFRGCVFVMLRVVPPDWAVDFDATELESTVCLHGGQILSPKLLQALKADHGNASTQSRTCYVVCWGGSSSSGYQDVTMHPLLSQLKRLKLCDLQYVTPIWLETCATEQKLVSASRLPELFAPPKSGPICTFSKHQKKKQKIIPPQTPPHISVTGFSGSKRSAMIHLIVSMGGVYDDSMRTTTTHLICNNTAGEGQKYQKAVEWNLHIVTVDWLYHVARNGLEEGSEARFAVTTRNNESSDKDSIAD